MKKVGKRLFSLCCAFVLGISLAGTNVVNAEEDTKETENTTMRVASWNVDSKAHPDINKMSDILNEYGVEIMGFQEIDVNNTRNDYDMVQAFVNDNYPYVHFAKGRDFANGGFGVGATSKYEFKEESSIPIESTSSKATKTLERVVIEKEGKEIAFYVTHTSWENTELRRRQFAEIIERVKADPVEYKILVADWNADQSLYEYTMFEDYFVSAQGKDGVWFDTFNGTDASMKVMTVDNILVSKNIRINNVGKVHTDMADHDMIYADIEFLDEAEGEAPIDNRALGQGVTATSTMTGSNVYNLNDYDMNTYWESGTGDKQSVVLELDRVYDLNQIVLNWGAVKPGKFTVSVSKDGTSYTTVKTVRSVDEKETIKLSKDAKFVKVEMEGKEAADKGYQIKELQIIADYITPKSVSNRNLLTNGNMEGSDGWTLEVAEPAEGAQAAAYELTYDKDAHKGSKAAKLTKLDDNAGDGAIAQTIKVKENTRYQLSFWHKTDTLDSASFTWEINQLDKDGNSISTYLAKLNDNLNMSKEYKEFDYNFITSPKTETVEVKLHVVSGKGSLYLDDVAVKEIIPTETVLLECEKPTLKVGEKTTVKANVLPKNANDIDLHWASSDESVVKVDKNGRVTAISKGSAYVGLQSDSDLFTESMILITVE